MMPFPISTGLQNSVFHAKWISISEADSSRAQQIVFSIAAVASRLPPRAFILFLNSFTTATRFC
jgi:hypothetical protein